VPNAGLFMACLENRVAMRNSQESVGKTGKLITEGPVCLPSLVLVLESVGGCFKYY
jgi:hypothetical protein